jgi:hypothetical protein
MRLGRGVVGYQGANRQSTGKQLQHITQIKPGLGANLKLDR